MVPPADSPIPDPLQSAGGTTAACQANPAFFSSIDFVTTLPGVGLVGILLQVTLLPCPTANPNEHVVSGSARVDRRCQLNGDSSFHELSPM